MVDCAVVALARRRMRVPHRWLSLAHWKADVTVTIDAAVALARRWGDGRLSLAS